MLLCGYEWMDICIFPLLSGGSHGYEALPIKKLSFLGSIEDFSRNDRRLG